MAAGFEVAAIERGKMKLMYESMNLQMLLEDVGGSRAITDLRRVNTNLADNTRGG